MRLVLGFILACGVSLALGLAGSASADPVSSLQVALPAGWKVATTRDSLVIERILPVKIAGRFLANAPSYTNAPMVAPPSAPIERLRLRYRTEPAWSTAKLAQVTAANKQIYAELEPLRVKYQIDDIGTAQGISLPRTPDEQRRLAGYHAAHDATLARVTPVPRCTFGSVSVFDSEHTYSQLDLIVEPQIAMREAYAVVELFKRRCNGR